MVRPDSARNSIRPIQYLLYTVCAILRILGTVLEEFLIEQERDFNTEHNITESEIALEVESTLWYVELIISLLLLAAGACLIIGILKHKAFLLVPFMVLFGIIVVIETLLAILSVLLVLLLLSFETLIMLGIMLTFLFVDASCLLCVISHYLNLRAGRENMRAVYRSQGERLSGDYEEGAAALPQKGPIPTNSSMQFTTMSDVPVSNLEEEAPPPYRDV
ncbi:hypothetical protein BSL78_27391 [Apostichopus japonicus]|uniref:Transmembrane protein n=1 Tax=Stichopus japonicus TaxID=307972 RepID=A0A2G8JJ62_STIJA|nr:hypothetical protein BSL78_27391 [Apostichopus japonicus]